MTEYTGWTLADLLFPPECCVLTEEEGNGIFSYWDSDGVRQIVVEDWVVDRMRERILEEEK